MGYLGTKPGNQVVNSDQIADGAVGTTDIANGAVSQAKLGSAVAGNGPAFRAYREGSNQSYSSNTYTKVQLNAENFDTANCFDSTTNYRFTPTVAGYYQITARLDSSGGTYVETDIFKNGSRVVFSQISSPWGTTVSDLIYMNGSTDYIEMYAFITTSGAIIAGSPSTYMFAYLARAA